jgi:hypothetical protein
LDWDRGAEALVDTLDLLREHDIAPVGAGRTAEEANAPHIVEINRLMQRFPDVRVRLKVAEGMPLSQLHFQDSYSHELAEVFVGGDDEDEFVRIYQECLRMLPFMIEERAKAV